MSLENFELYPYIISVECLAESVLRTIMPIR